MNLPYSVYGRAVGLQELVDQISPPSLFLVLKPFPDRIQLKEAAGFALFEGEEKDEGLRKSVQTSLNTIRQRALPAHWQFSDFLFLSPYVARFYCCEDSGTETSQ